ncbi:hypothetical protein ACO0LV_16505 [Pseudactinotalea sp. Z1739]|uniref:arsenate reductase/protein-tyrosine-phosphatase family protein n=1 Tax=Pseudactinotalea sp. Z1739 TaxID=3413028 RepID=UPI003C7AFEE7
MQDRVTFVCAMNVCRSPLLAATFDETLPPRTRASWSVESFGTQAVDGAEMCAVATALVEPRDHKHTASPVKPGSIHNSDLILTATTLERGILAQMAPAARAWTFTVREAILLGRLEEQPPWMPEPGPCDGVARRYAALLNARRGLIVLTPPRTRRTRRVPVDPFDIPDVHLLKPRAHVSGLRAAQQDARELAGQILALPNRV